MELITIREVLSSPEISEEWFYLPPDNSKWTLETKGVFSFDARNSPPDADNYLPKQVEEDGWIAVLDGGAIEEVVDNMEAQMSNPSLEDLFRAFVFYYENDAFLELNN